MTEDIEGVRKNEEELEMVSPVMKALAQVDIVQYGCGKCISEGNRYCYLELTSKEQESVTVTNGEGKCCSPNDFASSGCDPIGVQNLQEKYPNHTINLVCTKTQDSE
jgi:hypothetical protein